MATPAPEQGPPQPGYTTQTDPTLQNTPGSASSAASTAAPAPPQTISQGGHDYEWVPPQFDDIGTQLPGTGYWKEIGVTAKDTAGGSGAQPRNDALTAAQAALSGFLQAQSLADARKLAAMNQFQQLGKWAVPANAQYAPNFEPGGLASTAEAVAGQDKYNAPELQTARVNPGDTAGTVPPEVMQMIAAIKSAGGSA